MELGLHFLQSSLGIHRTGRLGSGTGRIIPKLLQTSEVALVVGRFSQPSLHRSGFVRAVFASELFGEEVVYVGHNVVEVVDDGDLGIW